jgi:hypothetical protein
MDEGAGRLDGLDEEGMHVVAEDRLCSKGYSARRAAYAAGKVEEERIVCIDVDAASVELCCQF